MIKRFIKWIGIVLGVLLLITVAEFGWGIYREPIAKKSALDFCASIQIGESLEGIKERAVSNGALEGFTKWSTQNDGTQILFVTFIGMQPFSRHICAVNASKVVLSAKYMHMD